MASTNSRNQPPAKDIFLEAIEKGSADERSARLEALKDFHAERE